MTMTETRAEPERNSAETAETNGIRLYFRGGRGTGYTLEWNSPAGVSRVSSRKKKNISEKSSFSKNQAVSLGLLSRSSNRLP